MAEKFYLKKDGKKCEMEVIETSNGIKVKTRGKGCKSLMGEYD